MEYCAGAPDRSNCFFFSPLMATLQHTGAIESGTRKPLGMKEPRFSARKGRGLPNSPHRIPTKGDFSRVPPKKLKKSAKATLEDPTAIARRDMRIRMIVGHGANYETAFLHAGDRFWEQVQALTNIERAELGRRKLVLGRHTLESVNWRASLPIQLSDRFVCAFVGAVRDRHFPKQRKAQARFLGDSLGADGELSARRSLDICGEQRAIQKRTPHIIRYEFYIECSCQFKGHSLGHACPRCGAKICLPFDSFLNSNRIDIW